MLIRTGILGLSLLFSIPGLSNAQQFNNPTPHCAECGSAATSPISTPQYYSTDMSATFTDAGVSAGLAAPTYATAQLPTSAETASRYFVAPQTMLPLTIQQPAYTIVYQQQASVQRIPVTTIRNVTVDRGSYQMVWVPRPVMQQIAETTMQPQVNYRTVAIPRPQAASPAYTATTPTFANAGPQPLYFVQSPSRMFSPSAMADSTMIAPQTDIVPMIAADPGTWSGIADDHAGLPLLPTVDPSYSSSQSATGPVLALPNAGESDSSPNSDREAPPAEPRSTSSASRDYERPSRNRRARGMFEPVRSGSVMWRSRYTGR